MKAIPLIDAVKAMGAHSDIPVAGRQISGVSTDSRQEVMGRTFFAVKGPNFDGHDFVGQAFEKGCASAVVKDDWRAPETVSDELILRVKDPLAAMQALAKYYIGTLYIRKVAVTGSVGKTTAREFIHAVFSVKYNTLRNMKNFNNDIGVPLTIFRLEEEHEAVVFEMGMDHTGDIHKLADMVRPDFAVITKIGTAHLNTLGSRQAISDAKWEIADFFTKKNAVIINNDDEMLRARADNITRYRVITAGQRRGSDFQITEIENLGEKGIVFRLTHAGKTVSCRVFAPGVHNAYNAAYAVAAGVHAGIPIEEAAAAISDACMPEKRLSIKSGRKNVKIIDDSYNANTDSVLAALQVLHSFQGGRKIAVLGDMQGLGDFAPEGHRAVGELAVKLGIDVVIGIGQYAAHIGAGIGDTDGKTEFLRFEDKEQLFSRLDGLIREEDVILAKGSRGMEMEKVVTFLQ